MTKATLNIDIVSAEEAIFSGQASMIFVTGEMGELGIAPGHTPLLTSMRPGYVRVLLADQEEIFYISSGMLEVQPYLVTVLADTAVRAHDIDEAAAVIAKENAEKMLTDKVSEVDFTRASTELAEAMAQISAVQRLRKRAK